jgi:hypothetical protein
MTGTIGVTFNVISPKVCASKQKKAITQ